jgi:hypothetical protein
MEVREQVGGEDQTLEVETEPAMVVLVCPL